MYVVKQKCTATKVVKCCFVDPICLLDIVDLESLLSAVPLC